MTFPERIKTEADRYYKEEMGGSVKDVAGWEIILACKKMADFGYAQAIRDVVDFLCSDTMNGIGDDNWWQDHGHDGKDYAKEIQRKFGLSEGEK